MAKKPKKKNPKSAARTTPELFFGLVGAVGTDLSNVVRTLSQELQTVQFEPHEIRLSQLLAKCKKYKYLEKSNKKAEHLRIGDFMDAGDDFRRTANRGDAVALLAMGRIRNLRATEQPIRTRAKGRAFILNSLKHPEEVDNLRKTYGSNFFAISVYEARDRRQASLCDKIARTSKKYSAKRFELDADSLIERDQKDISDDLGQDVRDSFPKADLFVDANNIEILESQIRRFVKIFFSYPFASPTIKEYLMYHAKAAALRSVDLSRQVGAVIASENGEILATGCNEVPFAGGGSVWECQIRDGKKDNRDFVVGYDSSVRMAHELIAEVLENLGEAGWLSTKFSKFDPESLAQKALFEGKKPPLKGSRAASVLEFGRIVHAEMAAICDAARRGISIKGATLYCTTFPCHMCARHIIASGIARVIYIEPYPKSLTKQLYPESTSIDHDHFSPPGAVQFLPFDGVGPRRYLDFFESTAPRKDSAGRAFQWVPAESMPKTAQSSIYRDLEAGVLELLDKNSTRWGIE